MVGGISVYATHIDGVRRASKVIKAGGYVVIGLGAAASGLKVKETCRVGTEEACRKVKFTEVGKFGGTLVGGAVGGFTGVTTCIGMGVGTVGVGALVCGVVLTGIGAAVVGDELGEVGSLFGELVYEVTN